jgi:CheY-like chemotaxis protein
MMVEMAQHMLTTLGYRVTCVGDSLEALRLLQERSADFDVLITDQTMPAMTGAELAKAANAIRADLPVILCTGHSIETDRAKAAAAGVSRIVMKPYRMDEIGSVIRDVVGGNRKGTPHGEHPGRR